MHKIWGESVPNLRGEFWRNKQKTQNVVIMYPGQTQNIVPSVDKGEAEKEHGHRGEGDLYSGMNQRKKARKKMGREGRECIDKRGICDKIRKNAERK